MNPNDDEFVYVVQGQGTIGVGSDRMNVRYYVDFNDNNAIIIPSGIWYTITNNSAIPIKIFTLNSLVAQEGQETT